MWSVSKTSRAVSGVVGELFLPPRSFVGAVVRALSEVHNKSGAAVVKEKR